VGRVLRLRWTQDMAERARAVSLRLPGQARRGHHDYQARLFTDIVTAIAVQEQFTDEFLDGLVPVLRHREAIGLWQLQCEQGGAPRPGNVCCWWPRRRSGLA
jgi:hypothetical protein